MKRLGVPSTQGRTACGVSDLGLHREAGPHSMIWGSIGGRKCRQWRKETEKRGHRSGVWNTGSGSREDFVLKDKDTSGCWRADRPGLLEAELQELILWRASWAALAGRRDLHAQ